MSRSTNPKKFFTPEESARVAQATVDAERGTSAEIKVVLLRRSLCDIRNKAARLFLKLGLHKTEQRNCVMIMLVLSNREFLIYGDKGIHEKVGQGFWDQVRDVMGESFAKDEFAEGLCKGIRMAGGKLAEHFPHRADDKDEISDEVAREE